MAEGDQRFGCGGVGGDGVVSGVGGACGAAAVGDGPGGSMTKSSVRRPWEIPAEWMAAWPDPQPLQPMFDLSMTTWGVGGVETRASRRRDRSRPLVPLLGYPDPNPMPRFRLWSWRRATRLKRRDFPQ